MILHYFGKPSLCHKKRAFHQVFSKDIFPMPHFKWGVVSFSDGDQESESFTLHFEGLKKVDGKAYLCSIN